MAREDLELRETRQRGPLQRAKSMVVSRAVSGAGFGREGNQRWLARLAAPLDPAGGELGAEGSLASYMAGIPRKVPQPVTRPVKA